MSFVIVVYNYSMSKYGVEELNPVNGGDVALSGMNIVNSVSMLVLMVIFGISQGAQPILGYNYGAKKFDRVLKTYKHAVIAATVVSCIGFALLHIFPEELVRLFAPDGSSDILTFGTKAMNIATLAMPIVGFQIVSTNLFVVTGRPKTSMLLSLTRQVVLLVPAIYLLGLLQGLIGVIIAAPIADALSSLLTAGFIVVELRKLRTASAEGRLDSNLNS
jgi:Na+-driven multidrug efflux pump